MKKNSITYIPTSLLSIFVSVWIMTLSASCSDSDENRSADARVEIENFKQQLSAPTNGWHLQYFPKVNDNLFTNRDENIKNEHNALVDRVLVSRYGVGGYNIFLKFNLQGEVDILTDIPYYPTTQNSYYKPEFNKNIVSTQYDVKLADGLNLVFETQTMLDELKEYAINMSSRFSPTIVSTDSIVWRTASYLDGSREYIVMKPLAENVDWQTKMNNLIEQKERFRTRFYTSTQQIIRDARRTCILQIVERETGETVYESTGDVDIASNYAGKRLSSAGWNDMGEAKRIARYDRLQYDLFIRNEQPMLGELSSVYTGLGSGYIAVDGGIEFKPGIVLDRQYNIVFKHFQYVGDKTWRSSTSSHVATIFLK